VELVRGDGRHPVAGGLPPRRCLDGAGYCTESDLLALLAAPTKDGHWLQFAQVQPNLFAAMLAEFGVMELLADPKWKGFPALQSPELYREFWSILLARVGERTLAEWQQCFDDNPDCVPSSSGPGPRSSIIRSWCMRGGRQSSRTPRWGRSASRAPSFTPRTARWADPLRRLDFGTVEASGRLMRQLWSPPVTPVRRRR
jgi:hypothetical protein